jgi:uncharacterized YigZ family protein
MESDKYLTINNQVENKIKVKGSRFIAFAAPVFTKNEAEAHYNERTVVYPDATHNCYAYKVGLGDQISWRMSDAGEPSGTAGKPIMQAIEGHGLTNIIIVVTRYFGGTKLGVGGLFRAYGEAADSALHKAQIIYRYLTDEFEIIFPFGMTNGIMKVIAHCDARIIRTSHDNASRLVVQVRKGLSGEFQSKIVEATAGKATIKQEL